MNRGKSFQMIQTIAAMICAVLVAFMIILTISEQPVESIHVFLIKPLTSLRYIGNIIEAATPLIFSGLAMSILFRAGLFNLGGEGVFFIGAVVGSLVAIYLKLPFPWLPIISIFFASAAGAGVMAVPGLLKAKYGTNVLVVSLMMNSIMLGVGSYILNNVMRDPSVSALVSYKYQEFALLPKILPGTKVHIGFLIALIVAVCFHILIFKTKTGFAVRMTGSNEKFSAYSGIRVGGIILKVHILAGIVCGMGGMAECLGMHNRFEWTRLPGYGFDGCMIAMLAGNNPLGVIGAAFFVAYLRVGADLVNRFSDVPTEMIAILQAMIILLISAEGLLARYKQKWIEKDVLLVRNTNNGKEGFTP